MASVGTDKRRHESQAQRRLCASGLWLILILLVSALGTTSGAFAQSPTDDLFRAVQLNDADAVETALSAGADLGATNDRGMTPADMAVDLGHFRIAHLLLAKRMEGTADVRVTDRGREALRTPSVPRQPAQARGSENVPPRLADINPPVKPPPPVQSAPDPVVPAPPQPDRPAPPIAAPAPLPDDQRIVPRESDVLTQNEPSQAQPEQSTPQEEGGLFSGFLGGLKEVVTLGGLIGGGSDTASTPDTNNTGQPQGRQLQSPADRFFSRPQVESESAAGRMVDRLGEMVGGEAVPENEFGLPDGPVVAVPENLTPAPSDSGEQPLDIPGLSDIVPPAPTDQQPTLDIPGLGAPEIAEAQPISPRSPPSSDQGAIPSDVPGLVPPIEGDIPGIPAGTLDIPGLPSGMVSPSPGSSREPSDAPPLDIPGLTDLPPPRDPPGPGSSARPSDGLDIPGLEIPGLDTPGLPETGNDTLANEVPGIIPPPGEDNAASRLPPGLAPLPGGDPNRLRRPGGLVEPEDTAVLPRPGSQPLSDRLSRIDRLLNKEVPAPRQRFGDQQPVATAPEKPPVESAPIGQQPPRTEGGFNAEEILNRSRNSDAMRADRVARSAARPVPRKPSEPPRTDQEAEHRLRPPPPGITTREEPATRMVERLKSVTERPYPDEDIFGLPVVRPSVDGTSPPRRDIQVSELEENRRERTDETIYALARFFRGDQEEQSGMRPPEVEAVPIPRVIDNMIPENDPARGRVVDDSLLDLRGVENPPIDGSPRGGGRNPSNLDPNFLNQLENVLGPPQPSRPRSAQADDDLGTEADQLDIPIEQQVPPVRPDIPDPWTMTLERSGPDGEGQTVGVSAISPEDGSEVATEQGVVTSMIGRIRQLLTAPEGGSGRPNTSIQDLDDRERQIAAEQVLSEAMRDGPPMALPDQSQWSVTEVETANAPPGVPPAPRPGALTRTSLEDVILSLGESVTLENTLPPQQDGLDPLNECIKKNRGTTLFCVEPIDWPQNLQTAFQTPTILYTGTMAITRYDQGTPSRFHALFASDDFEDVVAYYQARYGEPTEIWKRSIAPLAQPRMDNPTVTWRSRNSRDNVISVLEVRKFDDTRGGFPDTTRGAVMLYHLNAASIFPQVSSHELMRLRRTR